MSRPVGVWMKGMSLVLCGYGMVWPGVWSNGRRVEEEDEATAAEVLQRHSEASSAGMDIRPQSPDATCVVEIMRHLDVWHDVRRWCARAIVVTPPSLV
jgi:hypothetical protein